MRKSNGIITPQAEWTWTITRFSADSSGWLQTRKQRDYREVLCNKVLNVLGFFNACGTNVIHQLYITKRLFLLNCGGKKSCNKGGGHIWIKQSESQPFCISGMDWWCFNILLKNNHINRWECHNFLQVPLRKHHKYYEIIQEICIL